MRETFATIPRSFIPRGWVMELSDAGLRVFVAALGLAERNPDPVYDLGVRVELKRGEWMMSQPALQVLARVKNWRSFTKGLQELGPSGWNFMSWRRTSEQRNASTVWSITEPGLYIRTKEDAAAGPYKMQGPSLQNVGSKPLRVPTNCSVKPPHGPYKMQGPPNRALVPEVEGEEEGEELQRTHDQVRENVTPAHARSLAEGTGPFSSQDNKALIEAVAGLTPEVMERRRDEVAAQIRALEDGGRNGASKA